MNIAIAYRYTGEDPREVKELLEKVCSSIRSRGHDLFCSIEVEQRFRDEEFTLDQIYDFCRVEFKKRDVIFVLLRSNNKSKGIELELSDANTEQKPVVLATPRHVNLYRDQAQQIIEYDSLEELCQLLSALDFTKFIQSTTH